MKNEILNNINYLIGENAKDNWDVLDKSKQNWVWFHLDNYPSPYVVLMYSLNKLKKENNDWKRYINYGAALCKINSKYDKKLNIMWTQCKNVSKGSTIGEAIIDKKVKIITI